MYSRKYSADFAAKAGTELSQRNIRHRIFAQFMKPDEEVDHSVTNKTAKTAATSNFRDSEGEDENKLERSKSNSSINDDDLDPCYRTSGHFVDGP